MAEIIPFRPRRSSPRPPGTRARIEGALAFALDAVDQLVAALDDLDGDPDSEPDPDVEECGDDEPSLGAPENHDSNVTWLRGTTRDLEIDQQPEMTS